MAARVALLLALALALPFSAGAALPARSGVAQAILGRWDEALDQFESDSSLDRAERFFRGLTLLQLGLAGEALPVLRDLSRAGGSFSGLALEAAVAVLFDGGRYGEVAQAAEESRAERFQDEMRLRYQVGQSYFLVNRLDRARDSLERVAAGPYRPYALFTLGLASHAQGRLQEAVEILGKAVDAAGSVPDTMVGRALQDRIRVTRGQVVYQAATGVSGLSESDRARLFQLALAQFSRVPPASPFYGAALRGSGWCNLELGDHARAIGAFEAASEADPASRHEDLWAQGRVYQRLGYYQEAARFYGQARREALEGARRPVVTGPGERAPLRIWEGLRDSTRSARTRIAALGDALELGTAACDLRTSRISASLGRLGDETGRAGRLAQELAEMARGLGAYLDAIPASALFGRADRPRLERLLTAQERVLTDLSRLDASFQRLEEVSLWETATPAQKARAAVLGRRLEKARTDLSRSQLAFLEGLKTRVALREKELAETIQASRSDVAKTQASFEAAQRFLGAEADRVERTRTRLDKASERRKAVLLKVDQLEKDLGQALSQEARRAAEGLAARLRLRADAYALDETEALHLWREAGQPKAGAGSKP